MENFELEDFSFSTVPETGNPLVYGSQKGGFGVDENEKILVLGWSEFGPLNTSNLQSAEWKRFWDALNFLKSKNAKVKWYYNWDEARIFNNAAIDLLDSVELDWEQVFTYRTNVGPDQVEVWDTTSFMPEENAQVWLDSVIGESWRNVPVNQPILAPST